MYAIRSYYDPFRTILCPGDLSQIRLDVGDFGIAQGIHCSDTNGRHLIKQSATEGAGFSGESRLSKALNGSRTHHRRRIEQTVLQDRLSFWKPEFCKRCIGCDTDVFLGISYNFV